MDSGKTLSAGRLRTRKRRGLSRKGWLVVITVTLFAHLAIFLFFRLEYLEVFRKEQPGDEGTSDFVFIDQPFALIPYPDFPRAVVVEEQPSDTEEKDHEKSALAEIGEPSLTVDPIQSGGSGGGADGRPGPRRNTVSPEPLRMTLPKIPDDIDGKIRGEVGLLLYVNTSGSVEDVKLARSAGRESLDKAAMEAAWNFKFIPGEIQGVPTAMWIRLEIGFRPR